MNRQALPSVDVEAGEARVDNPLKDCIVRFADCIVSIVANSVKSYEQRSISRASGS